MSTPVTSYAFPGRGGRSISTEDAVVTAFEGAQTTVEATPGVTEAQENAAKFAAQIQDLPYMKTIMQEVVAQAGEKATSDKEKEKDQDKIVSAATLESLTGTIDPANPSEIDSISKLKKELAGETKLRGDDKKVETVLSKMEAQLKADAKNDILKTGPETTTVRLGNLRTKLDQYVNKGFMTPEQAGQMLVDAAQAQQTKINQVATQYEGGTLSEADALMMTDGYNAEIRTQVEDRIKAHAKVQGPVKTAITKGKQIMRARMSQRSDSLSPTKTADLPKLIPNWNEFSALEQEVITQELTTTESEDTDTLDKAKNFRENVGVKSTGNESLLSALSKDIDKLPMPSEDYRVALKSGLGHIENISNLKVRELNEKIKTAEMKRDETSRKQFYAKMKKYGLLIGAGALIFGLGGGAILSPISASGTGLLGFGIGAVGGGIGGYLAGDAMNKKFGWLRSLEVQQLEEKRAEMNRQIGEIRLEESVLRLQRGAKASEIAIEAITASTGREKSEVQDLVETYTGTKNYDSLLEILQQSSPVNYASAA